MAASASASHPDITLYHHPNSYSSQKVVMYLLEKKIPFRTKMIDIFANKQYAPDFLALSPRGEVPVLVDQNTRTIVDSHKIIEYLEDNWSNGGPKLIPAVPEYRTRCEELSKELNALEVEALTLGSCVWDTKDLRINPKKPYNSPRFRKRVHDWTKGRLETLKNQVSRKPDQTGGALEQKVNDVNEACKLIFDRQKFESLLVKFERILDECEAELATHEDPSLWLVAPGLTIADISLGLLLYRLWQLGYEDRMWSKRPSLQKYYTERISRLSSFQKTTTMTDNGSIADILTSPTGLSALGIVGIASIVAGIYFAWKKTDFNKYTVFDFMLGRRTVPAPAMPPAPPAPPANPNSGFQFRYLPRVD